MFKFPYLKNLYYTGNNDEFREKISVERKNIKFYNKEFLEKPAETVWDDGRFSVFKDGIEWKFLLHKEDSDMLYVVLSGAKNPGDSLPIFKRWSWYPFLGGNVLYVADPMLEQNNKLKLGWYYGTSEKCYLDALVNIIGDYIEERGIKKEKVVFYGSSGGGYASLYCACRLDGSMALVINPQIKLALHKSAAYFQNTTGIDLNEKDLYGRNDLGQLMIASMKSKFVVVENCQSDEDMEQLTYLTNLTHSRFKYGLSRLSDNIIAWIYDAGGEAAHNNQEDMLMYFAIKHIGNIFGEKDISFYEELYCWTSEIWHEKHTYIQQEKQRRDKEKRNIKHIKTSFDETIKSVSVVCKTENVIIKKSSDIWNSVVLYKDLMPKTIYKLRILGISIHDGDCDEITFLIKDVQKKNFFCRTRIPVKRDRAEIIFETSDDVLGMELKIYSGIPGMAENKAVKIDYIELSEIKL